MKWECTSRVEKAKKRLPSEGLKALKNAKRIIEGAKDINAFRQHPKVRKMGGVEEDYYRIEATYRWRVICCVFAEKNLVIITDIGPRNDGEIYKSFRRRMK